MAIGNENDRADVGRYLDGEMPAPARAAFEARLRAEPELTEVLAEAEALRAVFAVAKTEPPPVRRAGLSGRVLARLRFATESDPRAELERSVLRVARACVLAAAAVFAVATLFATGLLRLQGSGHLQADAGQELIRALDAKIQGAEAPVAPIRR